MTPSDILAGAVIALSSCAASEPTPYGTECLPDVHSELTLEVDAVRANLRIAQGEILRHGFLTLTADAGFCRAFSNVRIDIVNDSSWDVDVFGHRLPCKDSECLTGDYHTLPNTIRINATMQPLLHELLHAWDFAHGAVGSTWHEGWDTNGYSAMDREYAAGLFPTVVRGLE